MHVPTGLRPVATYPHTHILHGGGDIIMTALIIRIYTGSAGHRGPALPYTIHTICINAAA